MTAYYNEFDPYAAAWLRNLIGKDLLPQGEVDERSITEVTPSDIKHFTQCHFFAGIGGWPLGLRLAGWPDNRPVWTGSCPCQPYSVASGGHGGAKGRSDDRHLWPCFSSLIAECRPATIFGEQVASAIGWGWFDEAASDLEAQEYAVAALVSRASLAGADHERERLFWVADAGRQRRQGYKPIESVSFAAQAAFSITGDPFARTRNALAGDHRNLLSGDGVSVAVERCAAKGYGNAIVPQVAQQFVAAFMTAA